MLSRILRTLDERQQLQQEFFLNCGFSDDD